MVKEFNAYLLSGGIGSIDLLAKVLFALLWEKGSC
jgi:hypothetical protein